MLYLYNMIDKQTNGTMKAQFTNQNITAELKVQGKVYFIVGEGKELNGQTKFWANGARGAMYVIFVDSNKDGFTTVRNLKSGTAVYQFTRDTKVKKY